MSALRIFKPGRGLLVIVTVAGILLACNGVIVGPTDGTVYHLLGLVAVDPNIAKTVAIAHVTQDTTVSTTSSVKFDGLTLSFNSAPFVGDSAYSATWNSAGQFAQGNHTLKISDSTTLPIQQITMGLPGSLSIIGVTPANRLSNGSDIVKLDWFGGTGASGFVIAAVRTGMEYTGVGYSIYATSMSTSATFPREAFYQTSPTTPDTGWYHLYVYAYTGAPDSAYTKVILPVGFPSQLADNVNLTKLKGHVGTVRLAAYDSVRVALLP
ncbi:MAG: hypothetical protein HY851_01285 [candidate division Zixibacteria bacterium]|nr:hypothetical protein [candidate division Zixibacteria bacterium]